MSGGTLLFAPVEGRAPACAVLQHLAHSLDTRLGRRAQPRGNGVECPPKHVESDTISCVTRLARGARHVLGQVDVEQIDLGARDAFAVQYPQVLSKLPMYTSN